MLSSGAVVLAAARWRWPPFGHFDWSWHVHSARAARRHPCASTAACVLRAGAAGLRLAMQAWRGGMELLDANT